MGRKNKKRGNTKQATKKQEEVKQQKKQQKKQEEENKDKMEIESTDAIEEEKQKEEEANALRISDLKKSLIIIDKGITHKNDRTFGRAWRKAIQYRKQFTNGMLAEIITLALQEESSGETKVTLLKLLGQDVQKLEESQNKMQDEKNEQPTTTKQKVNLSKEAEIERLVFVQTLVMIFLYDQKRYEEAATLSQAIVDQLKSHVRVTLFFFSSKFYFFFSLVHEKLNRLMEIREALFEQYGLANMHHDNLSKCVIINLILRNFVMFNHYDAAQKFLETLPASLEFSNTSQHARFLYFKGVIQSVRLEYVDSYECLTSAIRKAPSVARAFLILATKRAIIVQLLLGEIPERNVFHQVGFQRALQPYFELTKEVRVGAIANFGEVLNRYKNQFLADSTFTLIQRLRQNVIRTGLHKIAIAYSCISFEDIAMKLQLTLSPEDVECIVAKAIRDGIIDAVIDHQGKCMRSKSSEHVYETMVPSKAFDDRIHLHLRIQQDAIKAMRYPPKGFPDQKKRDERSQRVKDIEKWLTFQEKKAEEQDNDNQKKEQ